MISGINSILTIFIMVGVGFFFTKRGWFNDEIGQLFSQIVIRIGIPAMAIVNISTSLQRGTLFSSLQYVFIAMLSMLVLFVISAFIAKFLKINKEKKMIFILIFTFSNSFFIGIPVNVAIFGEDSLLYVFLFFMANNITFWTLGAYALANAKNKNKTNLKSFLSNAKRAITPGLIAILTGYLIVLIDIKLPYFLFEGLRYLGNLSIPLSMIFIGIDLALTKKKDLTIDTAAVVGLVGRFVISPIVVILIMIPFGISGLPYSVFILEAAMPAQANTAIAAKYYDVESEYASAMVGLSTIVSMIAIPIFALLL